MEIQSIIYTLHIPMYFYTMYSEFIMNVEYNNNQMQSSDV